MEISASKNKSSFPENGLLGRRAPLAIVWIQPNDSVHHETIRLVSLNFRLRSRMAGVLSTKKVLCNSLFGATAPLQKHWCETEETWSLSGCRRGLLKPHACRRTLAAGSAASRWAELHGGTRFAHCGIEIIGCSFGANSSRSSARGCNKRR